MAEKTQREKEESRYKMLVRILRSKDGPEFLDYLKELSALNYLMFKKSGPDNDQFCKGYAVAIDSLHEAFLKATEKLKIIEAERAEEMSDPEGRELGDKLAPGDDADPDVNPHG